MNQRRSIVCVVAACVVATLTVASAARQAKSPWKNDPCEFEAIAALFKQNGEVSCRLKFGDTGLMRGSLEDDGLVHFGVAYVGEIDSLHEQAFEDAMQMWNDQSHVTGFVFKKTTATPPDFHFKAGPPDIRPTTKEGEPDEATSCSGYMASYVWYSRRNTTWLQNADDLPNGAKAYAHELGHALRLDDDAGFRPSIMRTGDTSKDCRDVIAKLPEKVQESDAMAARRCGCIARLALQGRDPRQ